MQITQEIRDDFERYLSGKIKKSDIYKLRNISEYKCTKIFNILIHEKIKNKNEVL